MITSHMFNNATLYIRNYNTSILGRVLVLEQKLQGRGTGSLGVSGYLPLPRAWVSNLILSCDVT